MRLIGDIAGKHDNLAAARGDAFGSLGKALRRNILQGELCTFFRKALGRKPAEAAGRASNQHAHVLKAHLVPPLAGGLARLSA
jgi:hypothetical protein